MQTTQKLGLVLLTTMTIVSTGCLSPTARQNPPWQNLLTTEEMPNWQLTQWRTNVKPWSLSNGVYHGYGEGGWVGHSAQLRDYALECDILFDGFGGGAIVFRGNRDAQKTWESGYSLGIGQSDDKKSGCFSFPIFPAGVADKKVYFEIGKWQRITAEIHGTNITVTLNGRDVLKVTDPENRFAQGQICLEDRTCGPGDRCRGDGHVKYRNLRILKLK